MKTIDEFKFIGNIAQAQLLHAWYFFHAFRKFVQLETEAKFQPHQAASLKLAEIYFAPGHFPVGQVFAAALYHLG